MSDVPESRNIEFEMMESYLRYVCKYEELQEKIQRLNILRAINAWKARQHKKVQFEFLVDQKQGDPVYTSEADEEQKIESKKVVTEFARKYEIEAHKCTAEIFKILYKVGDKTSSMFVIQHRKFFHIMLNGVFGMDQGAADKVNKIKRQNNVPVINKKDNDPILKQIVDITGINYTEIFILKLLRFREVHVHSEAVSEVMQCLHLIQEWGCVPVPEEG